ncbi:MAG: hypothetical protein K0B15_06515 [Lentimicrobium sp.]|nr:hypothetical protein [Lentimicrobium sp.]
MYNEEQLLLIEEYAGNFMSWQQIAILIDTDEEIFRDLMNDHTSDVYRTYMKARTLTSYAITKSIVKLAKLGSPQAELLVRDDIIKQLNAENEL